MRGVVSNGMLCSAAELEIAEESRRHPGAGRRSAGRRARPPQALGLEAVIDFEVTPNRPDWLGVAGIARDLAAAGLGTLKDLPVAPVAGRLPLPDRHPARRPRTPAPPSPAGVIRGVKNGPSPAWLQAG